MVNMNGATTGGSNTQMPSAATDPTATQGATNTNVAAPNPYSSMTGDAALTQMVTLDAARQPVVEPEDVKAFQALPLAEQQRLLAKWMSDASASGDPERLLATLHLVAGLASSETHAAVAAQFQTLSAQLAAVDVAHQPSGVLAPNVRAASDRVKAGVVNGADAALLSDPANVADLSPEVRGKLMVYYVQRDNPDQVRLLIEASPSRAHVDTALVVVADTARAAGAHSAYGGKMWMVERVGNEVEFNRSIGRVGDMRVSPQAAAATNLFAASSARAPAPGSPTIASESAARGPATSQPATSQPANAATTDTAAQAEDNTLKMMSHAEGMQKLQAEHARVSADGQISYDEMLLLMRTAADPEGFIQQFRSGDPVLMKKLAKNDAILSMIKDRLGQQNFMRDTMLAIQDDEISRRKKLADSLGKV